MIELVDNVNSNIKVCYNKFAIGISLIHYLETTHIKLSVLENNNICNINSNITILGISLLL